MPRLIVGMFLVLGLCGMAGSPAVADDVARSEAPQSAPGYNRDVRPILAEYCFSCHGADSASRKADLRLDQRDAAVDFGAIVPGNTDDSELLVRVLASEDYLVMPPPETKKTLSAEQKEILRQWIANGAEYEPHWAFIPPQSKPLPEVKSESWVKTPIDRFVLSTLEAKGLTPAEEADPRTLYRRVRLDVTGLPPAPEEVEAFTADYTKRGDAALSDAIDRLMESPEWGEHRARYWLDYARYGDTHGLHFDNYREMWPYRDWVIRSFNKNQPYDQFTLEQLAGDLLPNPTQDQLIATGFQRCSITTNEGGTIDEENLALYAADRVQTFGWVYLGLTTNCSQCHDHKFDPISIKDYYSLAAFFRNTTQGPKDGNVKDGLGPVIMVPTEEDKLRWEALPSEIAAANAVREDRRQQARPAFESWLAGVAPEALDADIPTEGLAAHLPLNEGAGGEVADTCVPASKYRSTGEVTWIPDGKFGPAPVLKSGSTFDLGELGDFEKDQAFSYGAWIRSDRDNTSGGILARMDEANSHRGWDLWRQNQNIGVHIIDAWDGNALKVVTRNAVLTKGVWRHVMATYDGSGKVEGIKIYVDGKEEPLNVEKRTMQANASIRTTTPLRIGQRSGGAVFEGGAIQEVRIYSRRLAASEVKAIADVANLKELLAIDAASRKPEQTATLYDYFLMSRDEEYPALVQTVSDLEREREVIRGRSPTTHVQREKDSPAMTNVLMRGEYDQLGEEVPAAVPVALHPLPTDAPNNRLGLAQWLIDPANPLTTRVTVNRFWQEVFGRGIVVTAEDFGIMGAPPSHPELLDWLAVDFQTHGWDVKRFYKQLLMSAAYRQAAVFTPEKLERDRDNAFLSRGPRFRMDAEMIRDYALATSGLLSKKMYGPSVKPYQPAEIWNIVGLPGGDTRNYVQDKGENLYRRSLYSFWKRMAHPPSMDALNAPSREVCTVRRDRTNTPLQALVMLNDPQFVEAARHLAQRMLEKHAGDPAAMFRGISEEVLSRPFESREQTLLADDLREFSAYYEAHPEDAKALIAVGDSKANEAIAPAVLAAWTVVCNQVLNLDETLNK